MTNSMIPDEAVEAAWYTLHENAIRPVSIDYAELTAALEAAAPHMAAQALRDAVDAFPLETITAPDNAVAWLMRTAEQLGA